MGLRPTLTTGRLSVVYTTDEPLTHRAQLDVNITSVLGLWYVITRFGVNYDWKTAADEYIALAKALVTASCQFTSAILYEWVAGVAVPRDSISRAVNGTHAGATLKAQQETFTYRDSAYLPDRVVTLGGAQVVPAHASIAALGGATGAFAQDFYTAGSGHIGNWYRSKDANFLASGQFWTASLNKRSRRKLGLT